MKEIIFRINVREKQVLKQKIPKKYYLLGGRELTSRILLDEIDPTCRPLGPKK